MASPSESSTLDQLLVLQHQVLTRAQANYYGLSDAALAARVQAHRWQRVHPGIYCTYAGALSEPARRWAAVLACGPGATLSHETAARLHGLSVDDGDRLHVCVPIGRQVTALTGVTVHRSRRLARSRHPALDPPCTMVDPTVIDLVHTALTVDRALALVAQACQRRVTTGARLQRELSGWRTVRWRRQVFEALDDVAAGAHSLLELRYLRDVERPHGLPTGHRQRAVRRGGAREWTDVSYDDYATLVELDGRLGHDQVTEAWRDMRRDNRALAAGEVSLRYGWGDVVGQPCAVAGQVAEVLRARGWTGQTRKCGDSCGL